MSTAKRIALVLSGGGARGAYQAGAARGLAEIARQIEQPDIFRIITGVSAGAINASYLAARQDSFLTSTEKLCDVWQSLNINQVFRTDIKAFSNIGLHWAKDIIGSGSFSHRRANFLLDASPLFEFLTSHIKFSQIQKNLQNELIDALALSATDYTTSESITFVSSRKPFQHWHRTRRMSEAAQITLEHVCASAAIPLFFAPVMIGERYFGDGCLRNTTPLSPAIHLQADRLIVIGVQHTPSQPVGKLQEPQIPSIAQILSVLLNSVLLDGVAIDVERLNRINKTLSLVPGDERSKTVLRPVDCLHISPTEDISAIAYEEYEKLPKSIRYLVGGLGSKDDAGNLVSFLLFVSSYCQRLADLGYRDVKKRAAEIQNFLTKENFG